METKQFKGKVEESEISSTLFNENGQPIRSWMGTRNKMNTSQFQTLYQYNPQGWLQTVKEVRIHSAGDTQMLKQKTYFYSNARLDSSQTWLPISAKKCTLWERVHCDNRGLPIYQIQYDVITDTTFFCYQAYP